MTVFQRLQVPDIYGVLVPRTIPSMDFGPASLSIGYLDPSGFASTERIPKAMITIPSIETKDTLDFGTLDPQGKWVTVCASLKLWLPRLNSQPPVSPSRLDSRPQGAKYLNQDFYLAHTTLVLPQITSQSPPCVGPWSLTWGLQELLYHTLGAYL